MENPRKHYSGLICEQYSYSLTRHSLWSGSVLQVTIYYPLYYHGLRILMISIPILLIGTFLTD